MLRLAHQVWIPVARLSYSAYLLQFVGIEWANAFNLNIYQSPDDDEDPAEIANKALVFASYVSITLVVCVLSFGLAFFVYMCVEKPVINLRIGA